jgi:hypothetical protein
MRPVFLPFGLPGVWNWWTRGPKTVDGVRVDAPQPIADLSWIAWERRHVIILYDLDILKKVEVQDARQLFTEELRRRGAEVS